MRKCFCVLVLILIFCLSVGYTSVVAKDAEIAPNAAVGLSSGLTLVSGSTYRVWASATAFLPEDVTVGFTFYRIVNGSYIYVTSGSSRRYGTYVKAERTVILNPGSYRLYAWYIGETQSDGINKYYTILR